jgi:hypothetical protein
MNERYTYTLTLDPNKVRQLCISQHWYTCGDSRAYGKMLDYVSEHEIKTEDSLLWVANDIINHSDPSQISEDDLETVVWALLNKCARIDVEENVR